MSPRSGDPAHGGASGTVSAPVLGAAAALLWLPSVLGAQTPGASGVHRSEPVPSVAPTGEAFQDTSTGPPVSPGGAFLRSLAVPGWGHAAIGSYGRAGFYFLTSAGVGWMLFKTFHFLDVAREERDLVEREVEAGLRRQGVTDPQSLAQQVDADPRVQGIRGLVESRSQQREDWTAFGIFWLLLNATDAFVSTHLSDFPEPVEIDVRPAVPGGLGELGELRISVPVGGF